MRNKLILSLLLLTQIAFSQESETTKDTTVVFKKRVLEATEVDFLASYYKQDGVHSSVSGGIGSENLTDIASNIVVAMPMNDDDVLTIDAGISAYTSASSSNINPYDSANPTPWQSSSGASEQDQLVSLVANYSHSSDNRNFIWNADVSVSMEYDYSSIGIGGGITRLFNDKNSEVSVKANVYLDNWQPIYPKELQVNQGPIFDQNGNNSALYNPNFVEWDSTNRNSYSASFSFSQVLTKKTQFSIFFDLVQQEGRLSTPYHRMYFADKPNFYVGNPLGIPNYQNESNTGTYQLADAIEKLPKSRFKLPIGLRWNYYVNEHLVVRTYYRYYSDNWDITAHTASIELPIKLTDKFTLTPMYRYYTQKQSKYFAPYETHVSTEEYYTSDYDLSTFDANQYGFGFAYTDIFTSAKIWKFGLKNIDFRFNHYDRSDGLSSNIGSIGFKFVMQ
ncbi:DUF3570 domain-containing protein [Flavobacterium sp.]|uniref:DUF3570 domain-containing protein n=1 Tax=Flavobacterium sp. TaxID=239 RepID=UPI002B4AFF39|nr:DUF3570 domain-containing protein [Flavobacterium sp.]HLP65249.1 DUF3570 domain-containing protein [Flavobacterium sp.]